MSNNNKDKELLRENEREQRNRILGSFPLQPPNLYPHGNFYPPYQPLMHGPSALDPAVVMMHQQQYQQQPYQHQPPQRSARLRVAPPKPMSSSTEALLAQASRAARGATVAAEQEDGSDGEEGSDMDADEIPVGGPEGEGAARDEAAVASFRSTPLGREIDPGRQNGSLAGDAEMILGGRGHDARGINAVLSLSHQSTTLTASASPESLSSSSPPGASSSSHIPSDSVAAASTEQTAPDSNFVSLKVESVTMERSGSDPNSLRVPIAAGETDPLSLSASLPQPVPARPESTSPPAGSLQHFPPHSIQVQSAPGVQTDNEDPSRSSTQPLLQDGQAGQPHSASDRVSALSSPEVRCGSGPPTVGGALSRPLTAMGVGTERPPIQVLPSTRGPPSLGYPGMVVDRDSAAAGVDPCTFRPHAPLRDTAGALLDFPDGNSSPPSAGGGSGGQEGEGGRKEGGLPPFCQPFVLGPRSSKHPEGRKVAVLSVDKKDRKEKNKPWTDMPSSSAAFSSFSTAAAAGGGGGSSASSSNGNKALRGDSLKKGNGNSNPQRKSTKASGGGMRRTYRRKGSGAFLYGDADSEDHISTSSSDSEEDEEMEIVADRQRALPVRDQLLEIETRMRRRMDREQESEFLRDKKRSWGIHQGHPVADFPPAPRFGKAARFVEGGANRMEEDDDIRSVSDISDAASPFDLKRKRVEGDYRDKPKEPRSAPQNREKRKEPRSATQNWEEPRSAPQKINYANMFASISNRINGPLGDRQENGEDAVMFPLRNEQLRMQPPSIPRHVIFPLRNEQLRMHPPGISSQEHSEDAVMIYPSPKEKFRMPPPGTEFTIHFNYRQRVAQQWLRVFLSPVFERDQLFLAYAGLRSYDRCLFQWKCWPVSGEEEDEGPSSDPPFSDPRGEALLWVHSELKRAHGSVSEALLLNDEWRSALQPIMGDPLVARPGKVVQIALTKYSPDQLEFLYVRLKKAASEEEGWAQLAEHICRSPFGLLEGTAAFLAENLSKNVDWKRVEEKEDLYRRRSEEVLLLGEESMPEEAEREWGRMRRERKLFVPHILLSFSEEAQCACVARLWLLVFLHPLPLSGAQIGSFGMLLKESKKQIFPHFRSEGDVVTFLSWRSDFELFPLYYAELEPASASAHSSAAPAQGCTNEMGDREIWADGAGGQQMYEFVHRNFTAEQGRMRDVDHFAREARGKVMECARERWDCEALEGDSEVPLHLALYFKAAETYRDRDWQNLYASLRGAADGGVRSTGWRVLGKVLKKRPEVLLDPSAVLQLKELEKQAESEALNDRVMDEIDALGAGGGAFREEQQLDSDDDWSWEDGEGGGGEVPQEGAGGDPFEPSAAVHPFGHHSGGEVGEDDGEGEVNEEEEMGEEGEDLGAFGHGHLQEGEGGGQGGGEGEFEEEPPSSSFSSSAAAAAAADGAAAAGAGSPQAGGIVFTMDVEGDEDAAWDFGGEEGDAWED
uniref:Uncharacterized protein n=1 Tax=Chromera velia CCMP2878 TaxID=1169474 RepID=A0A0G4HS10_9ALVE|eukprot:Cvel_30815.t1-p1 / transcript=Cvel_30815.t1 / gene=Cvel_30815 / organism=Chromera_velia_CCMP2878 / gene_product=hypothetical protein / transcript_product=hypothetical protein / location=Cvel_scaffold4469:1233-7080(-) / protein_length=1463 / sequence_SO=supercontig / SO=protein_coding / is_pseudo=false